MVEEQKWMCPHCGWLFPVTNARLGKVPLHSVRGYKTGMTCPGWGQVPRNPETDRRPLWKNLSDK